LKAMTQHIVLDVFIGLSLTYLLYSMYASIAMEVISSSLGLRAENLHYALKRMLMDEKSDVGMIEGYLLRTLNSFTQMVGMTANMKNPELFDTFINQPTIKYLSNGGSLITNRSASYIHAEFFSKALIDSLQVDEEGLDLASRLELGFLKREENLLEHKQDSETLQYIRSLFKDADRDVQKFRYMLERWFDDSMERAAGWYKKTTQLIIFIIGIVLTLYFDLDTLQIARKLSTDAESRAAVVEIAKGLPAEKPEASLKTIQEETSKLRYILVPENKDEASAKLPLWKKLKRMASPGYLLTILALSLGAPFWFDLLNKFVGLRSAQAVTQPAPPAYPSVSEAVSDRNKKINRIG